MVEYTPSVSMLSGGPLTLGERVTSPTPELTPELNSNKSVDEWGTFQKAFMERQIDLVLLNTFVVTVWKFGYIKIM